MLSTRLTRTVPDKDNRKAAMVMMTMIMRTVDLDQATSIYKKLQILLCSRWDSDHVHQTYQELIKHMVQDDDDVASDVDVDDSGVEPDDGKMQHESATTIKQQSPFTQHFASCLVDLEDDDNVRGGKRNNLYSPASFKVITDLLHLYLLWAAALHDNVGRFAADVTDTADNEPPRCRSNAIVESHFKSVKHGYKKSRKLRPRLFVTERLRSVLASVNQAAIKFPATTKRRRSAARDDPPSAPEVWNRTPKRRRYGDKDVSLRVLGDLHAAASNKSNKACIMTVTICGTLSTCSIAVT